MVKTETLEYDLLMGSIEAGHVGMVLEHAAGVELTNEQLKQLLAEALNIRAGQLDEEARIVDASWGIVGKAIFETTRAQNLRKLAIQILGF